MLIPSILLAVVVKFQLRGEKMEITFIPDIEFYKMLKSGKDVKNFGVRKGFYIEKQLDEDRVIEFTISTPVIDRANDIVNVEGWKLDNYMKNPVVLWAHCYDEPPVAKSLAVWKENNMLKSKCEFTPREINPFGYMVYQLYRDGFLNATSVGFYPQEYVMNEERGGVDYVTQELLEYSCVPVPANPEALISAKSAGIDLLPLKDWAERVLDTWNDGIWIPKKTLEKVYKIVNNKTIIVNESGETNEEPPVKEEEVEEKVVTKPGFDETENSWRYRVRDLELFIEDSFRTKEIDTGVSIVMGKLKSDGEDGPMTVQSIIFDKEVFPNESDAQAWLDDHEDLTKAVIFIEEKAGRVLSEKNRSLISSCVKEMKEAISALEELLQMTEVDEIDLDTIDYKEEDKPDELNFDAEDLRDAIKTVVSSELRKLIGKLD